MIINNKLAHNKLFILYILSLYNRPVSHVEVSDVAIANDLVSYFTLAKYLKELERDKFVIFSNLKNSSYFAISETGEEALNFFITRLDKNMLSKIKDYIEKKIDYGNTQPI